MAKKNERSGLGNLTSDFANLASHQLRTPLSGMKWMLELLQKPITGSLNQKQREFIEKIYTSNERMIALVNDLLEVSRIEQGETKLYLQPTDLTVIIRGLIKDREKEIKKRRLKVSFTVETEPFPVVRTEPTKIKQALSNLISNAVTYTLDGGKISIDLTVKEEEHLLLCSISDTGLGIPKDQQGRIFNKFFRGNNVVSVESVGSGLGLYIAKSFVDASGGKIWFKSEENKGTTFYLTLPIIRSM